MNPEQQPTQWEFKPATDTQPTYTPAVQAPVPVTTPTPTPTAAPHAGAMVAWSASEFVAYHKSAAWFVRAFLGIAAFSVLAFFFTRKDIVSTVMIVLVGIVFTIIAARKPRVLTYSIDDSGVHIGEKLYPFGNFRSFALIDEVALRSISLLPLKRFMPAVSMYFDPKDEQKIVTALGLYLAQEDKKQDAVDRLMHKIRF